MSRCPRHSRVCRLSLCKALLLASLLSLLCGSASADVPLDVAHDLRGVWLGAHMSVLEDPSGALTLSDVREPTSRSRFVPAHDDTPNFGFTRSAYWVRLEVDNSSSASRAWLLEVGYPQLDHVTLFVPRGPGGYEVRATGDMLPFGQRDLAYRNVVFTLEEPAHGSSTYYMRVDSRGAISLPLTAWTLSEFAEHQYLDWSGLCIFYGVLLVMTLYNLALYAFTRDPEYRGFALFVLSIGAFQVTIVGHTFQYLFPNDNAHAQTAVPVSIAVCMYFGSVFCRDQLTNPLSPPRFRVFADRVSYGCLVLVALAIVLPFQAAIRVVPASCGALTLVALLGSWRVLRGTGPKARLFVAGWVCLLSGAAVHVLKTAGLLPNSFFTQWSPQIGASIQFVLVSAAMATKLTWLRTSLRDANELLAQKVRALENAVRHAELATARAQCATRVKDEFMATMSHELRTPLNTIINIPLGLVEEFALQRRVACAHCQSNFELEPDESIEASTVCPECQRTATLKPYEHAEYIGQPTRTVRYLETIERSGMHLLQVVNAILRTEPSENVELSYEVTQADQLVRDVVEEMSGLAERSRVSLKLLVTPGPMTLPLDPLRIRQVLINLIGNAIKFSNGQGTVTVSVAAAGGGCAFSVRDEGIGIASSKLDTVFHSYQQVHGSENYGGTGLGLPISRALVQKHGGELWVESELGRGTTFHFHVPYERERRARA